MKPGEIHVSKYFSGEKKNILLRQRKLKPVTYAVRYKRQANATKAVKDKHHADGKFIKTSQEAVESKLSAVFKHTESLEDRTKALPVTEHETTTVEDVIKDLICQRAPLQHLLATLKARSSWNNKVLGLTPNMGR